MEFIGKVIGYFPTRQSESGGQKLTIYSLLLEEGDKYKNNIYGMIFHSEGKEPPYLPPVGEEVKVSFNLVSREFNGKWYTNVKIWRMVATGASSSSGISNTPYSPQTQAQAQPQPSSQVPQAQPPKQQTYQQVSAPAKEEPYDSANANDVDLPF